ncbi:tyrosine-type recombinase/integrase [Phenylobacterium sp.]|uniref:tyrosine-type recombinase/integrase n=1 Tax=Phenylobacterium sp. TaxID=1871053 RepID=UPI002733BA37|nr:tyrosine-type recombinase/integrase [Phenylobacterium sp.]MDP3854897.1 tyrosine-type recombinase/integrase [Phenylobacterium sp.]
MRGNSLRSRRGISATGRAASSPTTVAPPAPLSAGACRDLRIDDLHFHDLRHEATSRLFEAEYEIPEVSLVTGHRDWKMLQRYTHIRPEDLHAIGARRRAAREPNPPGGNESDGRPAP